MRAESGGASASVRAWFPGATASMTQSGSMGGRSRLWRGTPRFEVWSPAQGTESSPVNCSRPNYGGKQDEDAEQ